ncbi:MAG: DUF1800 domain-containing protein [Acidobacteriota bacterium]
MASIAWNEQNAAHLLRRAAFGGTGAEIDQAVQDGLDLAVDKLINFESIPTGTLDSRLASYNLDLTTLQGIAQWWIYRMVYSPRPLEERMTLFLHDHFATAISKVRLAELMLVQNNLFRRYATGKFVDLTIDVSKDIAMLVWLDNYTSRKEHPNENYGRELLELFTLGQGYYSEPDVFSAAKAFTGWTYKGGDRSPDRTFLFVDAYHDHTQKDFLGRVGDWNGDDIVRIATGEFAHGRLIAGKLFSYLVYDSPDQTVIDNFARIYLDSGTDLKVLVAAILKSPEMYSAQALWTKVKSPVDHTVIGARQLLLTTDKLGRLSFNAMSLEGLTLFNPPDVSGWDDGLAWISAGALLTRMNTAGSLAFYFDPAAFIAGQSFTTPGQMVDFFLRRLGPLDLAAGSRGQLINYVAPSGSLPNGTALLTKQRGLAHMILSLPEWQTY